MLSPALSAGVPCASTKPPNLGHIEYFEKKVQAGVGENASVLPVCCPSRKAALDDY